MTPTLLTLLVLADPFPAAPAVEVRDDGAIVVKDVLLTLVEQREVPAREAGVLTKLHVREGMLVKPDEELGRIDATDVEIVARRAEVELSIAKERADSEVDVKIAAKSLELAEDAVTRAKAARARSGRAVTDAEMREKRLARDVADLEVDKAKRDRGLERLNEHLKETELEAARRAVERRRIVAPIGGKVVQVHRRPGDWVEPGTAVLRILRVDPLRAEALLPGNVATAALEGRPVTVNVGTDGEHAGKVVFVSPEVNEVTGEARVWVDVANPELELRPGQRVRMTIHAADPMPSPNAADVDRILERSPRYLAAVARVEFERRVLDQVQRVLPGENTRVAEQRRALAAAERRLAVVAEELRGELRAEILGKSP